MKEESIVLYCQIGRSDKVYQVQLKRDVKDADNAGWIINFQYGRRGSTFRHGTKTPRPVQYYTAKTMYDKLIRSKLVKGYTQGEVTSTEVVYTLPEHQDRVTTFRPQLLNQVTEEEAKALWGTIDMYLQLKHDGERRGILYSPDSIVAANRRGLKVTLPDRVQEQLEIWHGSSRSKGILDCEDMGSYLVCFDSISSQASEEQFADRALRMGINQLTAHELNITDLVFDIPFQPRTFDEFQSFITDARLGGQEGIVIRDGKGIYEPGKPNSGGPCWKLKFYEDATCRVRSRHPVKRSVMLELWHSGYNDQSGWVEVGNCTIPTNYSFPDPGDLVEVRYLYAFPQGSLYQPVYKGKRTDVGVDAAVTMQLKYKEQQ
jgi:bifunctional non-homologous end joining protein LigD